MESNSVIEYKPDDDKPVDKKPVNKKPGNTVLIVIIAVAVLCVCAVFAGVAALSIFQPVIQNTYESIQPKQGYSGIASEELKNDVIQSIADYESTQTGCADVTLYGGEMMVSPSQTQDGSWQETWKIDACGESHLYAVTFTPSPQGGTDFSANRLDK